MSEQPKQPARMAAITPEVRAMHAELLWSEYRYRHEHIWKILFQLTAATVLLAIAPCAQTQMVQRCPHPDSSCCCLAPAAT
jgi:hypothetical protein